MPLNARRTLSALILLAIFAGLMIFATSASWAATRKCVAPAAFFADMPKLKPTAIPPLGYARARELLDAVAKEKLKPTDAAWLLEAVDGSMVLVFGRKGCIRVMMPVPTSVPLAMMRFILLGEVPHGPPADEHGA